VLSLRQVTEAVPRASRTPRRVWPRGGGPAADLGYAMAALLVGMAILAIFLAAAMPVWRIVAKREREEELVFRGQQYARAVGLFQRKFPGAYPPSIDFLIEQRFLRKKYKDPMTADGEFQILFQGGRAGVVGQGGAAGRAGSGGGFPGQQTGGGISLSGTFNDRDVSALAAASGRAGGRGMVGVVSKSTDSSLRVYNGRTVYNEWQFIYIPAPTSPTGPGGVPAPGIGVGPGRFGSPGMGPGEGMGGAPGGLGIGPGRGRGPGGQGTDQRPFGRGGGGRGGRSQ
jgi:type II secretory pathway pseudopilin PulG